MKKAFDASDITTLELLSHLAGRLQAGLNDVLVRRGYRRSITRAIAHYALQNVYLSISEDPSNIIPIKSEWEWGADRSLQIQARK